MKDKSTALESAINQMDVYSANRIPYFFMFDFSLQCPVVYPLDSLPDDILIQVPNFSNVTTRTAQGITLHPEVISLEDYKAAFDHVTNQLSYGNSYLTNLTFRSRLKDFDYSLDEVFHSAKADYKLKFQDDFVVFSPESFVSITGNTISTYPMKGTRLAKSIMDGKALLDDTKEMEEHATIVDLMRNDLSQVASNVTVPDYRYMQIIKSKGSELFQTSSKISGTLKKDYRQYHGSIMKELLPAGSISGAPKQQTLAIINAAEHDDRGYYTGVFGVFDGESLASSVMIRFIEKDGADYYFRSGGGITHQSTLQAEYDELIQKIYVPIS